MESITFILNGVYVAPGYRHRGVGRATLIHVSETARAMAKSKGCTTVRYQVRVDAANDAACKLYQNVGFREAHRERLQVGEKRKDDTVFPPHEAVIIVMERFDTLVA
jgi:GNAT superfamily N-acetyltransferase